MRKTLKPFDRLTWRKRTELSQLLVHAGSLCRKLVVVIDQLPQQTGQEAQRQLLKHRKVRQSHLLRLGRVLGKMFRFQVGWQHG